jgi:hypothetical protein
VAVLLTGREVGVVSSSQVEREDYWEQFEDSSAKSAEPWPSKSNPADRQDDGDTSSTRRSLFQPLTRREGVSLRAELEEIVEAEATGQPVSWREAVWRWRDYIKDKRGTETVFRNTATGETAAGSKPHRFAPDYANKQYAKLKDLERGLRADYGKRLHTALISLTASSTDEQGQPRPPVDHLDDLLSSQSGVMRSLRRVTGDRRAERLVILEPHESGYLHLHIAVFVEGVVMPEEFQPVIDSHLENCATAGEQAHQILRDDPQASAVSVNHVGGDRDDGSVQNLGTYLAEYLGTFGDDPLDCPEYVQMANALLWATKKRRWRPSNGSQTYMKPDPSPDAESAWEIHAMRDENGNEYEITNTSGTIETFETEKPPPG